MCRDGNPASVDNATQLKALADWLESQEFPTQALVWRRRGPTLSSQTLTEVDDRTLDWLSAQEYPSHPHLCHAGVPLTPSDDRIGNAESNDPEASIRSRRSKIKHGIGGALEHSGEHTPSSLQSVTLDTSAAVAAYI